MTLKEYQQEAVKFRTPESDNAEYLRLGLIAEVGEVAGKLAKKIRDGVFDEKAFIKELGDVLWFVVNLLDYRGNETDFILSFIEKGLATVSYKYAYEPVNILSLASSAGALVFKECDADEGISGIMYNLACLAMLNGYNLSQVAEINLAKLRDRQFRGVINGNGDER